MLAPSVQLQERDLSLLRELFESRIMTLFQVSLINFDGKSEAAKKRVQKLKAAGFIRERRRRVNQPSVLSLTRQGFGELLQAGHLDSFPKLSGEAFERRAQVSETKLQHELEVMDVKASLVSAVRKLERFEIPEFCTWPALHSFSAIHPKTEKSFVMKPDGFIRIHEKETDGGLSEHAFFLEVDRSTEAQEILGVKARCYLDYYRKGGFAEKHGAPISSYKEFPFRVLFVCKSEARRDNTAMQLLNGNPPILTMVWLTTFAEATEGPLEAIWVRPGDYRGMMDQELLNRKTAIPKFSLL